MFIKTIITRYGNVSRDHTPRLAGPSGCTGQRQSAVLSRRELRALILDMVG